MLPFSDGANTTNTIYAIATTTLSLNNKYSMLNVDEIYVVKPSVRPIVNLTKWRLADCRDNNLLILFRTSSERLLCWKKRKRSERRLVNTDLSISDKLLKEKSMVCSSYNLGNVRFGMSTMELWLTFNTMIPVWWSIGICQRNEKIGFNRIVNPPVVCILKLLTVLGVVNHFHASVMLPDSYKHSS